MRRTFRRGDRGRVLEAAKWRSLVPDLEAQVGQQTIDPYTTNASLLVSETGVQSPWSITP